MPTRTARTAWNGSLEEGSGEVELSSSKSGTYGVSFPKRAADEANGSTSPEELIAAAHSSCFAMQLSAEITSAGGTTESLDVRADVSMEADPDGGFKLIGIKLTVHGKVSDIDEKTFLESAEKAKTGCPVSKALTGVEITMDAALES